MKNCFILHSYLSRLFQLFNEELTIEILERVFGGSDKHQTKYVSKATHRMAHKLRLEKAFSVRAEEEWNNVSEGLIENERPDEWVDSMN